MSTKDIQAKLSKVFSSVPIVKTMNFSLEYDDEGNGIVSMPNNTDYYHGMNDTHGGVMTTLLDMVGWFTVAAQCEKVVLTSDLNVRLLSPAKQRDLVATAKIVRSSSKSAVGEMKLHSADGDLLAIGTAAFSFVGEIPL